MKKGELRNLVKGSGLNPIKGSQPISVLVSLDVREPDPPLLARLADKGLTATRVIGSTVLGMIDPGKVAGLRQDQQVRDVEPSVTLKPHS